MTKHLDGSQVWPPHIERLMRLANDVNAKRRIAKRRARRVERAIVKHRKRSRPD
jgi:hypothetical protein